MGSGHAATRMEIATQKTISLRIKPAVVVVVAKLLGIQMLSQLHHQPSATNQLANQLHQLHHRNVLTRHCRMAILGMISMDRDIAAPGIKIMGSGHAATRMEIAMQMKVSLRIKPAVVVVVAELL